MKLLLISYAFPPVLLPESILAAKAVAGLASLGVEVTVISVDQPGAGTTFDAHLETLVGGAVHRIRVNSRARTPLWRLARRATSLAAVPDAEAASHRPVLRAVRREIARKRPDALMTWSQWHSAALVGLAIKRSAGLPWVAHFSDPWNGGPYITRRGLAAHVSIRMERSVVEAADVVTYTSDQMLRFAARSLPTALGNKGMVIPHSFDARLYATESARRDVLVFRFLGAFYGPRTPLPLLRAVSAIARDRGLILDGVRFEFVGPPNSSWRRWQADTARLPCVSVGKEVGYLESLAQMADADVLVVIDAPGPEGLFLPSKLIDYLGANRPILAVTPLSGPASDLVRATGGIVADPDDVAGIAAAVETLIAAARHGRLRDFWRPPPGLLATYSLAVTSRQRLDALERAIARVEGISQREAWR